MVRTTLQASVSKTAVFNGTGVDISGLAGPSTVLINVTSLTAAKVANIQIQTSVDDFSSDVKVEKQINVKGPLSTVEPYGITVHDYEMPGLRVGTTSAKMRIVVSYIDSATTIVYGASLVTGA
jgi:hypothetical protein